MGWLSRHYGDAVALYLLHLGIVLVLFGGANEHISHIGESLILTGVATLRFKGRDIPSELR